ncbi:Ankyrin repeat domain-containing protein 50-like protein [Dinothrombium tinctorium]|uniref:Ankyrin repeat domain-containing protein 50-like protein n=1 Tax=Dinothrombium tinctorium TaxID=1965070 RepID=A0A3S5WGT0_9ACAR|nr:Ankyrin repeat domain-containing protein 50-like protein [Dinothrombium tinctorium]RWS07430.1 Ankyrin repeat domain-containing protein 50-like protein [Dinothrombium tinctorium]RWS11087.1 Ankyrin repeat domain-containing protein 50-like protein [Dinothrombium tinctorium]
MDDIGYTALHLCAERGYLDLMRLLIDEGARVKFTELKPTDQALGNPPRATLADEPLRLAIKNGHFECAELLLRSGADPNARYFLGAEINLISPLNISFMELLLKYGADPDSRDRAGLTPLMKACRHPQGYAAAKMLIGYGADPNAMTSERHDYRTVLHYAVLSSNVDTVRLVLNHGASVEYPPELQKPTPLDFAILRGNLEMIRLLLDNGANVNNGSPIIGLPLHIALSEKIDNKNDIVHILLERGADPNAITLDSRGPLLKPPLGEYFNSNENVDPNLVRLLLKYGARIIIKTQFHHPLGILKSLHKLHCDTHSEVLHLIVEAAESYNGAAIKRCNLLNDRQKEFLLKHAFQPIALKHMSRLTIRQILGSTGPYVIEKIDDLPVPNLIKMYLLYEV